jgi:hypothetical protein
MQNFTSQAARHYGATIVAAKRNLLQRLVIPTAFKLKILQFKNLAISLATGIVDSSVDDERLDRLRDGIFNSRRVYYMFVAIELQSDEPNQLALSRWRAVGEELRDSWVSEQMRVNLLQIL